MTKTNVTTQKSVAGRKIGSVNNHTVVVSVQKMNKRKKRKNNA